ncbi:MAG: amidohydrolase family protein, partial [Gemmatimonadota bacterium]|nr:amidohydrolase family protein [Gemmatimonadota bacterium]
TAVGANVAIPSDAQRIDATGKWVTPGLINSATQLGLVEIGQVTDTRDSRADGKDNIAAAFRVWDGLNPSSVMLAPARKEGVTTFVVLPSGGLVSGQAAIVDLVDGTTTDMLLRSPVAMVAEIGDAAEAGTRSRGELLGKLRELLDDTKFYMAHRADFDRAQSRNLSARRVDLEAMIPVLQGKLPLLVAVDKESDIDATLALGREYGLKLIIGGGAEAWMMAGKLAAAHVPVLTGAMNNIPNSFSTLGQRQENAALLNAAGVPIALVGNAGGGDEEAFNVRNIKQEAGNSVAYGLAWDNALKAVTLWPAQIFGVADRVGSLEPGREANVVVWSGDPFEFSTRAEHVWVRGVERTNEKTRQDLLTERYLNPAAKVIR